MLTYSELLNTVEWKSKRLEILKHNLFCQHCKNCDLLSDLSIGYIKKSTDGDNLFFPRASAQGIDYDSRVMFKNAGTIMLCIYDIQNISFKKTNNYVIYFDTENSNNPLDYSVIAIAEIGPHIINLDKLYFKSNNPYRQRDFIISTTFVKVNGLHIHHTYYQDEKLPWEYPNESLMVLCWKCHESLHKQCKIPRLNEKGQIISELTPCLRCFGMGYFPEYLHVENGICFRCRGARYEEFIAKS